MIVIGLTGSIGMGKTRVASLLKRMGIPVHDSDKAVHKAMLPNGAAYEAVVKRFPDVLDKKTKMIDRRKLGGIVFQDEHKLKQLEDILHPVARQEQMAFLRRMIRKDVKAAVLEIPLLFETGAEDRVDYVLCVSAPASIQRRRVLGRKGMTSDKLVSILKRQMPDVEKRARADFVIQTGIGLARTMSDLQSALKAMGVKL